MMIDLDHFKNVNDTYGHQAGDEILKMMGDILKGFARAEDVACRYGGEEFLLLLPKMALDTAQERAESLRQSFSSSALPFGEFRLNTTLSVGVAIYPGHGKSADELLQSADRSLYAAKRGGRNRVEVEAMVPLAPPEAEPGSVIQLLWQDQFLTGNAEIDAQHRALFVSANALLDAVASRQPAEQLRTLTDLLLQEVIDHFRLEEALLEHTAPSTSPHIASHRELLDRAAALIEKSRGGAVGLGDLLEFLAEDLVSTHICQIDVPAFSPAPGSAG
jgi:diguanylate cyclase (GGDEF)-like protein/hemerythrin-like metal-binding protein